MPQFIEVEYDPFAPVPVDHDPWEGQSDPFVYNPMFTDEAEIGSAPLDRVMRSYVGAEGQMGQRLHSNATGIFVDPNKPPPAGDEVIYAEPSRYTNPGYVAPSTIRGLSGGYTIDTPMPGVSQDENLREFRTLRGLHEAGNLDPEFDAMRISDRRALDLGYTPSINQDDFSQRYPLAEDVRPRTPDEAWFERPSWLQGETPEGYAQPYPSPSGLSGNYSRGKLIGPQSPLRGTYRHVIPF